MQITATFRWVSITLALVGANAFSAGADLAIYNDGLTNAFEDRGWTVRDFANTAPVHSGQRSISVTATEWWQGISIYHWEFDTTPYASLSLWVNGGTNGGQRLEVKALLAAAHPVTNAYHRFNAPTNGWERITIPLASLGVADNTNFTGFWIQLTPTGASNTFYVDDIQLDTKPAAPVVAAIAAPPVVANALGAIVPESRINAAWWIAGVLTVITGLLVWLILLLRKSGVGQTDALVTTPVNALARNPKATVAPEDADAEEWKQRALAAEAIAANQTRTLADKVIPELTEFAKQSLVQGLYAQRNALLENQQRAQEELVALESRLTKLQLPYAERIQAYEKRISELEAELDTRGEEMRELTKTTLVLMRQKLEDEKKRPHQSRFN